jgi:hypothetical protein
MPNNATPIFDPSVYTVYSWHLFQKLVRVPEFSSEFRVRVGRSQVQTSTSTSKLEVEAD